MVFDDPEFFSVPLAARDFSLFDQQGCLSPHTIYVGGDPLAYAERLAAAMAQFNAAQPRSPITQQEAAQIHEIRLSYGFRAAAHPGIRVWASHSSTDWTVILDPSPGFAVSCLNRVAFVKPLPGDLAGELVAEVKGHLSAIGIWPANRANAEWVEGLGASRICPVGCMQSVPVWWHQDGGGTLAPLVQWQDFEAGDCPD